ncbi:metallophosphoesterase [Hydrogenophaga sp.]|uniref:metallophosphoesterase family protein n=1 Tax=Hydrogenophaga sp. TaxID=1904254 RepID=UPI0035B478D9
MKLALLSDIHANIHALDACLAHARQAGCDRFALLGDLVGYGGDPVPVMERVIALANDGAVVLKGNHDALAVTPPAQSQQMGDSTAQWTHEQLSAEQRGFLDALPMTATVGACFLVHASADAPEKWRYVEDERSAGVSLDAALTHPGIRYVFGGHVHHQTLYYKGSGRGLMAFKPTAGVAIPTPAHRQWIATVGSVGQPRDGQPTAMYALFDLAQARLSFLRVPYDHAAAAASVRRAGLPEYFAKRLEEGR